MKTEQKNEVKGQGKSIAASNVREIGKHLPAVQQKAMELPQVIKTVEQLFKKVQQRDRLELYRGQLENFDIKKNDDDLEPSHHYAGCKLEITDDNNSRFLLKHPVIIKEVVEFIKARFTVKLAEVEAEIKLPNGLAA